jgi:hypothetical protein
VASSRGGGRAHAGLQVHERGAGARRTGLVRAGLIGLILVLTLRICAVLPVDPALVLIKWPMSIGL